MYPTEYRYSKEHEWVAVEGDTATVGITDFAQQELGDIVYVEVPEVGRRLEAGEIMGTVESVKAVSEIYSPIGGEVTEVNPDLAEAPEKINQDPHGNGWICRIKVADSAQLESLMAANAYEELIAT